MKGSPRRGGKPKDAPSRLDVLLCGGRRALEWPGTLGWVGTIFAVAGVWFVASAFALRSRAARMEKAGPQARAAAESARRLGFGEWFVRPVLVPRKPRGRTPAREAEAASSRRSPEARRAALVLPDPLAGAGLTRARMGVRANARASGVFGVFALLVSVFLWGFRRYDPAARSDRAARPGTREAA